MSMVSIRSNATSHTMPNSLVVSLINLIALQTILFLLRASDPDEFFKSLDIFGKIAIAGIFKLKIF